MALKIGAERENGRGPERANDEMVRLGTTLVARLFILLKTSLNYSEGHAALDSPVANVMQVVREIQKRHEEAALRFKGRYLYLGELRLKPNSSSFEVFSFVMEEMRRHGIGGLGFSSQVSAEELRRFGYALQEVEQQPAADAHTMLLERMQQRMIDNIEVATLSVEVERVEVDQETLRDATLKTKLYYHQVVKAMDEVMESVAAGKPLRLREPKRLVQHLIDMLAADEPTLLRLTTLRCHDAYTENHAANVCILSLAIGRRLDLSKFTLCELGLAALFHDIGKAEIPREILDKPEELTPEEQSLLESHPVLGVRKVMRLKGLDLWSSRMVTGIFEHHLLADFSGYPRLRYRRLGLFGRIISIADAYDTLTSSRVSGRSACPGDKALRHLLSRAGKEYDPGLLKLFIGCIGLHAIGSLLQLDSKELAVVVRNNPDPGYWGSPRVKIIASPDGKEIVDGEIVDLADPRCSRIMVGTLDPRRYDLDVSRYFL